ncbi:TetR/AcrR family transcriptional regulator [Spirillospora sp. CA-294931]|uniref:TetR/AcrR family transcriptional regulator n=1 Tax=Spirillospora sp. CA-294931 TaxID=3240042 RepID=UPI003D93C40F
MAHVPAEQRRQQLITAAFQVVAKEGVAAASTRRIAAEAGVPAGVVHYCFQSRRELLTAMMSAVFEESEQAVRGVLSPVNAATDSPEAQRALRDGNEVGSSIAMALEQLWELYRADPERHQAVFDLTVDALRQPETAEILRRHQARIDELGESFLSALADQAGVTWNRPVAVLSRLLIATVDGILLGWLIDRDDTLAREGLATLTMNLTTQAKT